MLIEAFHKERKERIIKSASIKHLYAHVNIPMNPINNTGLLHDNNWHIITSDFAKAEVFNNFFQCFYCWWQQHPKFCMLRSAVLMDMPLLTPDKVKTATLALKKHSSCGHEGWLFKFIKLFIPLYYFRHGYEIAGYTHCLEVCKCCSHYKSKGSKISFDNYRLISLTITFL